MSRIQFELHVAAVVMVSSQMISADFQRCGPESSLYGAMLRGHTFQKMKTKDSLECLQACNADVRCQSLNYVISTDVCELNNRTKEERPKDFVSDEERFYLRRFEKRSRAQCSKKIIGVGSPVTHETRDDLFGSWVKDPLGIMGNDIFVMGYHQNNLLYAFETMDKLRQRLARKRYVLPYHWDGTGGSVYGRYLYYNRRNTYHIIKYDILTEAMEAEIILDSSGRPRSNSYQWGGNSGVNIEVDGHGVWVLWGSTGNNQRLYVSKVDVIKNVISQTWPLNTEPMTSIGNAFIACGVVYCIDDYSKNPTTINFSVDIDTGMEWNPSIQFINQYGFTSMVQYNPREKVLYAWDNARLVTYSLTFDEEA